jgi:hypothetical protein
VLLATSRNELDIPDIPMWSQNRSSEEFAVMENAEVLLVEGRVEL